MRGPSDEDMREERTPMSTRLAPRSGGLVIAAALAIAGSACVDSLGGAVINVTFDPNVDRPAQPGATPENGQPPAGTYFSFYAVQYDGVTECVNRCDEDADCPGSATCDPGTRTCRDGADALVRCPSGSTCNDDNNICTDDATNAPLIESSAAFKVVDFEIQPLIAINSPCFIEHEERPYPGLHVTQELNRLMADTGITDPFNPPPGTPEELVTDVITAQVRQGYLPQLQGEVSAVTTFSNALPPGVHPDFPVEDLDEDNDGLADCVEDNPNVDPSKIPPPHCIGDESNARRAAICEIYWKENPSYYEGSDLVFTLPLNGRWRGSVTGSNPKNAGFLSGANFYVENSLDDFDALLVQWQYKDLDGDGEPDYPDGTTEQEKSPIGYHYLEGFPLQRTRGVVNVPLSNRIFSPTGEAAVFPNLGEDDVNF